MASTQIASRGRFLLLGNKPSKTGTVPVFLAFLLLSPVSPSLAQEPSPVAAPVHNLPISPAVVTYDQLISAIRKTRVESRARIEEAARQEKVREAWEIGRLIDEHVLQHQERAEYGAEVIARLAQDLDMGKRELYYMLEFARTYLFMPPASQLSWAHYRELLSVNDPDERLKLAEQAELEDWSRDRLREEVKAYNVQLETRLGQDGQGPAKVVPNHLDSVPGQPGVYRVTRARSGPYKDQLVLDLGFSNDVNLDTISALMDYEPGMEFQEGDIVRVVSLEISRQFRVTNVTTTPRGNLDDLYTYYAYPIKIIDGDTIAAVIDLGFGFTTVQTLRLRGLDAPEIESAEGRESKVFLESLLGFSQEAVSSNLAPGPLPLAPIIIRTTHSDKYDRYLVDIWYNDIYVNQKLIEEGLAVVIDY